MTSPFTRFFQKATNDRDPYPYQERFATADGWPHLLRAPTGAGKTATAVLGWLYRWMHREKFPDTPRRLVYCLPMRVLVEQSFREATTWIGNLTRAGVLHEPISVHRLMGGVEAEEWYLHPERPAVLIGTQDMLLSRALNRGYAASRFHWPIDFGLLNNDCLWVYDEPQLMGSGVSTSAQLAGLRQMLGTFGPCPSVWMSATLEPGWLDTVDFRRKFTRPAVELGNDGYGDDYAPGGELFKKMTAAKTLAPLGVRLTKDADEKESAAVARKVLEKHQAGTQTLVVLNTVKRAKLVYQAIRKLGHPEDKLLLVHSRFRPYEREERNEQLRDTAADRIIVATQVVEAGVDISARTLVTELAPWASVVQRIGRCNRTGNDGSRDDPARVFWIDTEATDAEKKEHRQAALPYLVTDLNPARGRLEALAGKDVSPRSLEPYRLDADFPHTHVLRRRDLSGLFDTAPDLSGNDIDVKHYVRGDDEDLDVKVFWRRPDGDDWPRADEPRPRRVELCNVPVGQFRPFLTGEVVGFVWDHLDRKWARLDLRQLRPGLTVLLPETAGGYHERLGWTGDPTDRVSPVAEEGSRPPPEEAAESDPNSETAVPRTIAAHTESVCRAVERIIRGLPALSPADQDHLRKAARWHDAGKGHGVFQKAVQRLNPALSEDEQWAKSGKRGRLRYDRSRRRFRHELASALALLQHRRDWPFVVAYMIAAHHGKVRLGIRALPGEEPSDPSKLYALGVLDGDGLPPVDLGGETCPAATLDLSPMRLGGESSWTARALRLLGEIGPFRLAYLEAVLRAADQWVSDQEREGREP